MEKIFISDLKTNERVDSVFMLTKKNLKLTKHDKPYLEVTLCDKTGKIEGRVWDNAEKLGAGIDSGDIVGVKGSVDSYKEEKQIKIESIRRAEENSFRHEDMVRVVENREELYENLLRSLSGVKNKWIKLLSDAFVGDKALMGAFKEGLGGKSWHNAYVGGLLEHTYEVMWIVEKMCELYPEVDRDVAVFGAFIHDIGKVAELDPKKMEYTIEGGLVGHLAIGHKILIGRINGIKDFPLDLALRFEHIILSHHGKYEQQSPVLPKTLEATIIYHADELVSQANAIKEIILSQSEKGKVWSDFVSIKNRKYFIKDARDENWSTPEGE